MKVERRLGLGTWVPPPKPAAEAQAVPRRFCCHRSLALGCLARAASVQMRQAEGQPPHLAPWRGGGACLTHGCCPAAKLCPWGCLFHRHSSPGGPVAALRTGLGLWAQEDLPRRAGAGCFLPAVQTLLIKQPAHPHQGPCPSQTVGLSTQKAAGASATWGRQGGAGRGRAASDSLQVGLASATQSGIPGFWPPRLSRLHSCLLSWSCQAAVFASVHICALPLLGPSTWHRLGGGSVLAEHALALNGHSHYGPAS